MTGTNGKTSTVEMTRQIWRMAGPSLGLDRDARRDHVRRPGEDRADHARHRHLPVSNMAGLKRMGISHVAYEASSHGLDQHRAEGVPLAAAAFTNFSRDHLDYHADDGRLFRSQDAAVRRAAAGRTGRRSIWTDDPKSDEVIERARRRGHRADDRRPQGRDDPPGRADADPARPDADARAWRQDASPRAAADRRLPGGERADRGGAGAGDRRRVGRDLLGDAARRAGARAAGARGDQPRRRAGLHRLCAHARRARGGDRRASAARRGTADHRVRRGRRPRPGQAAGNGRGRGAAVATS